MSGGSTTVARIQDYALIGDGRSAALVSRFGSIDWLCWPRFDSPSLFAALLDARDGGHWHIRPTAPFRASRRYVEDSNVLVTTFETSSGTAQLTDLMSVSSEEEKRHMLVPEHELLRRVECLHGEVELELQFRPRPDYGRKWVPVRSARALGFRLELGPQLYTFRASNGIDPDPSGDLQRRFRLRAGERCFYSLTFDCHGPAVLPPLGEFSRESVARTISWWRGWARRSSYTGPYEKQVTRSLLVLKLLSYAPSGAVIAAPTTSLPERVGGDLNWDYRYCWLRDASLTVRAFLDLGYEEEAGAFVSWLLHSTRMTRPELRVLYDVYGELPKDEQHLHHLRGYRGSRPVRVQNAAADQLQLDTYGEVIDAVTQLCRRGAQLDRETQTMLRHFGEYVRRNWQRPDDGIWEPRAEPKHYTHSRVLCWAALDRLLELHRTGHLESIPRQKLEYERSRIREDVETHGWNPGLRSYTQVLRGDTVDASLLLLSWYGFAGAEEPRMKNTFRRILERLTAAPALLYRYEQSRRDGEGAFGICSFWAAEFLARGGGTLEEAEACFEQLLPFGNDVGLFAEELDAGTGEPLGNFPQAFTHVGLVSAALAIEERRREEAKSNPQRRARGSLESHLEVSS